MKIMQIKCELSYCVVVHISGLLSGVYHSGPYDLFICTTTIQDNAYCSGSGGH